MAKATIVVGDKTVTFEGPEDFVTAQVEKFSDCSSKQVIKDEVNNIHPLLGDLTERRLVEEKEPKGHPEIVAVLAFVLANRGQVEFSEEDIKKAYIRANVRPPKVVGQALRDAKNNYDYLELAGQRGLYRLTTHGDRTVRFDLPRRK